MRFFRLLFFMLLSICSLNTNAQHLEFMGIPITGSLSNFQTKLLAKGCKLASNNNDYPSGIRAFNGVFAGKDCDILVWYNHRSKQVYQTRAITDCSSLDKAHECFNYYKGLLRQKYLGRALFSDLMEDTDLGEYELYIAVADLPVEEGSKVLGYISLTIIDFDNYLIPYGVAITYEDAEESSKNKEATLEDL